MAEVADTAVEAVTAALLEADTAATEAVTAALLEVDTAETAVDMAATLAADTAVAWGREPVRTPTAEEAVKTAKCRPDCISRGDRQG